MFRSLRPFGFAVLRSNPSPARSLWRACYGIHWVYMSHNCDRFLFHLSSFPSSASHYHTCPSLSWHLWTCLEALGRFPPLARTVDEVDFVSELTMSYASQLEMSGQLEYAVYVLLHAPASPLRNHAIKSLVSRHSTFFLVIGIFENGLTRSTLQFMLFLRPSKLD